MIISNKESFKERIKPQLQPKRTTNTKSGTIVESNQEKRYVRNEKLSEVKTNTIDSIGLYKINNGTKALNIAI